SLGYVKEDIKSTIIERVIKKAITKRVSKLKIFDNLRSVGMRILTQKSFISLKKAIAFAPENYIIFAKKKFILDVKTRVSKIVKAYEPNELYGSKNPTDPDLIVFDEQYSIQGSYSAFATDDIISRRKIFDHSRDGVFIAFGNINKSKVSETYNQFDIVPTILSFFGLPIPHDTDGKIIEHIAEYTERKKNYTKKWKILRKIRNIKKHNN
ncbi:MAG: hypothetical protein Q6363_006515, partial [Candidatus Njordarchaeota archaeon]